MRVQTSKGRNVLPKVAAVTVSTALVAIVVVVCVLRSALIEQRIARSAERVVSAALASRLSIGSLRLGITGSITCTGIVMSGRSSLGDSLRIDRAAVRLDLGALLRRRITLRSIELQGVRLFCGRGESGVLYVPFVPAPDTAQRHRQASSSSWTVHIGSVVASEVGARYIDSALSIDASLSNIAVTAHFHRLDSLTVAITSGNGHAQTPWWRGSITRLAAKGDISASSLLLEEVLLAADSANVQGKGTIAFRREGTWDIEVDAWTKRNALCVLDGIPHVGAGGSLAARAKWSGTIDRPVLSVDARATDVQAASMPIDTLTINARYDSAGTLTARAGAMTRYGAVLGTCTADVPGLMTRPLLRLYDITASASNVIPEPLLQRFGIRARVPVARAEIKALAHGRSFRALPDRLAIEGTLKETRISGTENRLVVQATLTNGSYRLAASDRAGNRVNAEGRFLGRDSVTGTFDSQIEHPFAISRYVTRDTIGGTIALNGTFAGAIKDLHARAAVCGSRLAWRTARVDTLHAVLGFRKGVVSADRIAAQSTGDLGAVLSGFGIGGVGGQYTLALNATGTVDSPSVHATLRVHHPRGPQFHASELSLVASFYGDSLHLERLRVTGDSAIIEGSGAGGAGKGRAYSAALDLSFERAGCGRARCSADARMANDSITASLDLMALCSGHVAPFIDRRIPFDGVLSCAGKVRGALRNPALSFGLDLQQTIDSAHAVVYRLGLTVSDSVADVRARAVADGVTQPLSVDASLPLSYAKPWSLRSAVRDNARIVVRGKRLNVREVLAAFLPQVDARGTVSLDAEAVRRSGVWAVTGAAGLVAHSVAYAGMELLADSVAATAVFDGTETGTTARSTIAMRGISWQGRRVDSMRATAHYARDSVHVDTLLARIGAGFLFASGVVPLKALDTALKGGGTVVRFLGRDLPLAAAGTLGEGIVPRHGTLAADGSIALVRGRPVMQSVVSVRGGELQVMECAPVVGPISADLLFAGDSLVVKTVRGAVGKSGVFSGKGIVRFGDSSYARLSFEARDCRLRCTDLDAGIHRLAVAVTDSANMFVISGDVDMAPSRYATYLSVNMLLSELERPRPVQVHRPDPFLERVWLRTTLKLNRNVTIETNLGRIVVDGRLAVVGNLKSTGAIGTIDVVEGHVYYFDRKFTIVNGSLRFRNPYAIAPEIDLAAKTTVTSIGTGGLAEKTYEISLRVTGDIEKPSLTLTADDPSLRSGQIVSLLTFGTIQGDFGGDLSKRVESLVKQQLAGFGTRKLEQWLNIESLNVEPVGKQDAVVTAVKRLSPRLTVSYQTTIEDVSKQKATASYRLMPFLYVDGTGDYAGRVGADLRLRWSK